MCVCVCNRTVFLRLASLGVLVGTLYTQITCSPRDACNVGMGSCPDFKVGEVDQPCFCIQIQVKKLFKVTTDLYLKQTVAK